MLRLLTRGCLACVAVLLAAAEEPVNAQNQNRTVSADSVGTYSGLLVRRTPYQYDMVYTVQFAGKAANDFVPSLNDSTGTLEWKMKQVAALAPASLREERVTVRVCLDDVCARLDTSRYDVRQAQNKLLLHLEPNAGSTRGPALTGKEDIYLEMEEGAIALVKTDGGAPTASPLIQRLMPAVADRGNFLAGGPPLFRMDLSPLSQSTEDGGQQAISLDFEGGIQRYRSSYRMGFTYEGSVAAQEELAFNSIRAQVEFERNLRPDRYVPLLFTGGAETDQDFSVMNGVLTAQLRGLLPFNLNLSPRDTGYIPNSKPVLTVRLEQGWNVRDEENEVPSNFTRPGYGFRWKVPVARNAVVRLDHDGRWSYNAFFEGAPDFHPMWDAGVDFHVGDVTYFVGYRRGEAPPVFREVKTAVAGVVFGVR